MKRSNFQSILLIVMILASCKSYKQDILFKLNDNFTESDLTRAVAGAEKNYQIQVNDQLSLDVYTNKGERIVDPNFELVTDVRQTNQLRKEHMYLVKIDGTVKFPIIGQIEVIGLTIDQAETLLQTKYNDYYKDSFLKLEYANKRVVVLGAIGGQIIPLTNENLTLVEILALSGGFDMGAKAQNIKIIRGSLSNPEVYQIDLSTLDGMRQSMLNIEPGDIIYVEPWRRPWLEGIKDVAPVLSLITSTLAMVLILQNIGN